MHLHVWGVAHAMYYGWRKFSFIRSQTTLYGHTMAVTSVDWKKINGVTILATCSDDRVCLFVDHLLCIDKWQWCK